MVWFHVATGFSDFAIGIAVCWHPATHTDADEEDATESSRRHLGVMSEQRVTEVKNHEMTSA